MLGVFGPILRFFCLESERFPWMKFARRNSIVVDGNFAAELQVLRHRQILLKSRSQAGRENKFGKGPFSRVGLGV